VASSRYLVDPFGSIHRRQPFLNIFSARHVAQTRQVRQSLKWTWQGIEVIRRQIKKGLSGGLKIFQHIVTYE